VTKVVFETATFADAIKKADRVAPSKGSAFDKSAGIVIEVITSVMEDPTIIVKATDTTTFYMEWVDAMEVSGESTVWRLPSKMFAGLVSTLPIGSGSLVTLQEKQEEKGRMIHLTTNKKTRCKFSLIDPEYYPEWDPFDEDSLKTVTGIGGRINQVAWAAAKNEEKIDGVHFDGEHAIATDRYRLVQVPMDMDLSRPITVPSEVLAGVIRQSGDVKVGTDGNLFLLAPDEHAQIKTIMSGHEYPNVGRIMRRDYPEQIEVKKTDLLEIMNRALQFVGADRFPTLRLFFGKEEINVFMADAEKGMLGDAVDIEGQAMHDRVEIKFTPKNIMEALEHAPNEKVTLHYDLAEPMRIFYIDGGSGYECWVVPRKGTETGP
jgi:DNA polymerase III sliding clamp (beta) subunit (PCNA family)